VTGVTQRRAQRIEDLPPIEAAAAYLLKNRAPVPELLDFLTRLVSAAETAREAASRSPSRSETRTLLGKVRDLARELNEALGHPTLAEFHSSLTRERRRAGELIPPLEPIRLELVAEAAELALEEVPAAGGSTRLGDVLGHPRPEMLIAVGVVVVWEALHGRRPSSRNGAAINACWHLSRAYGHGGSSADRWAEHLAAVRSSKWAKQSDSANAQLGSRILGARFTIGALIRQSGLGGAIGKKENPIPPEFEELPSR
jgi:hypothetical protein